MFLEIRLAKMGSGGSIVDQLIHFHFLARVASSQFYSVSCYLRRRRRLKEYESWDGIARMGCVAVRIDRQGTISQDMVHLVGFTEPKRLDA